MKKLIINADDFGLHECINLGIIEGHVRGCITSTSIMPGGAAFEHAITLLKSHPRLGVGVHLTLVGEKPVADPSQVSSLIDDNGKFPHQYPQFLLRYISGKVSSEDIRRELTAQVAKVFDAGIKVTHIDSHQHLHIMPGIMPIVLDIAKEFSIKAIRIPDEPYLFLGGYPFKFFRIAARCGLTFLSRLARLKTNSLLASPQYFFGMLAGGNMREEYLTNIINTLPDGVSEIMMHPGLYSDSLSEEYNWGYHWQDELSAVMSRRVLKLVEKNKISLVSFGELANG